MTQRRYLLTIKQGATLMRFFQFRNAATDAVIDLSTLPITDGSLVIRDSYGGAEIVTLTVDNGGIVIENDTKDNGFEYSGYIYMSQAATAALEDWGDGVFDFELSDGSSHGHICDGIARLSPTTIT